MTNTSPLSSDEKPTVRLKRLATELRELEVDTFEIEDAFDLGQDDPLLVPACNSCTVACCTSCFASTAAMPAHKRQ